MLTNWYVIVWLVLVKQRMQEWEDERRARGEDPTKLDVTTIKLSVPYPLIGHLIGKGGMYMKEMNRMGATIRIFQDEPSHTKTFDERPVIITGPTNKVIEVEKYLCDR